MNILVIGAGAWGTALAMSAAAHPAGHAVQLWARDPAQAQAMRAARENARYLARIPFPSGLTVIDGDVMAAAAQAELIIVATPMAALREWLQRLAHSAAPVAWLSKGFEAASKADAAGLMAHEVCAAVAPQLRAGVFSLSLIHI